MVDTLGWRCKFGVITPSTNTVVQPEYDAISPAGVTTHIGRMYIPDDQMGNDADFDELIRRIDIALEDAVERVMTCKPDHFVLGISSESIWGGGLDKAAEIMDRMRPLVGGIGVSQAADALPAALKAFGVKKRVSVVTPYFPVAEPHIQRFASDIGFDVVRTHHMSCKSPTLIAHVTEDESWAALREVDGDDVEAIIQFGANLPFARVAAEAERRLHKPVIAVNVATYWHALRSAGIADKVHGHGRILWEH
jgi:maleate isomerase